MDTRSLQKLKEIENRLNEALAEDLDNDESFDMEAFEEEIVGYKGEIQDMEDMDYLHMSVSDEKKIKKVKGLIEKVSNYYEFFDPQAELGFMFPNGMDDDDDF